MDKKNKVLIGVVFCIMLVVIVGIVYYYWHSSNYFVSTDNAQVKSDYVNAVTQMTATLTELDVQEGDTVEKDQIIARQEMKGTNVSNVENSVIRAPISGIVVKTAGTVGATVPAGTTIAVLADPSQEYITANIEETSLSKIQEGQPVDVTIDQFPGVKFSGTVSEIGMATDASFSVLPQSSSGTFTKVVQTVPIKISITSGDYQLLPGTSAEVKIHIK